MARLGSAAPVLLWALTALLASPAAFAGAESAERHYVTGREHLAAGNAAEAAREFAKAVAADPNHIEAHYQLGLHFARNIAAYDKAEREFLDLPEIAVRAGGRKRDDILFRAGLALGKLYIKKGLYEDAIKLTRNVAASAPPGAPLDDAYNTLGIAYYYERLYEDAILELRRAIKLNPNNTEAHFNLKTIRARLEHFQAAKIYSRMGERQEAAAQYRKAIALDPRFIEARYRLGAELFFGGNLAEALKELNRAESISPDYRKNYEIRYTQGLVLKAMGRAEEATRKFEQTVAARPGFAAAHNEIGLLRMGSGDLDGAIGCFVTAIGIDPKTEYVRNLQAAFARKGK
ncbi:MAG: tetratricopeptide repeat protein [Deltaproteobacteria bacterium]|nr:tetratricopeptide repeat protein [Deltaproteobacteria bacterium]